jgi:hypothetical protein
MKPSRIGGRVAPLGFCEFCGAERIIPGQRHCESCGRELLQLSEVALRPVPAMAAAVTQAAPEAPDGSAIPVASIAPTAPVAPEMPVTSSIPRQSPGSAESLAPALPLPPLPDSDAAPTAARPWATTAPGNAAATPPAELSPTSPAPAVPGFYPTDFAQPPASAPLGEVPIDAATGRALRRGRPRLPLFIGVGLAAVVALAGGVYFLASSKPANPIITVFGVELKVASVQLTDAYGAGNETIAPSSTTDAFLVVKCDVLSSSVATVSWDVSVAADKGGSVTPSVTERNSQAGQLTELAWVFVVPKTSRTYVLNFPDGQKVQLDSFVTTSGPSGTP